MLVGGFQVDRDETGDVGCVVSYKTLERKASSQSYIRVQYSCAEIYKNVFN